MDSSRGAWRGMSLLTGRVREFYERFPYPHYPLFATPRWQEGYSGASFFAGRLAEEKFGLRPALISSKTNSVRILCAGSGEIQPYVLRRLEPNRHSIQCVDLARGSLLRAKIRLFLRGRRVKYACSDLREFLKSYPEHYQHCDAYGVLHHLSDAWPCQL